MMLAEVDDMVVYLNEERHILGVGNIGAHKVLAEMSRLRQYGMQSYKGNTQSGLGRGTT
jgi:hypothetical protein